MKILHLLSSLDYCHAGAQVLLLAKLLPTTHGLHVCCLGQAGPWTTRLRQQGRRVDCLNWTRAFDPTPLWKLHRLLKTEAFDLIHVWGQPALHTLAFIGRRWLPQTLVSQPLPAKKNRLGRIDRWLLNRVRAVVASNQAEAAHLARAGISADRIVVVRPGVELSPAVPEPQSDVSRIMCIGAMKPHKGFRDALWAFDILRYISDRARLLMVGDGPQRSYLEWFAGCLQMQSNVDFLGRREDVPQLLEASDLCWSPSGAATNQQVVLEAMAAGRPVIAAARPGVDELIVDGETGFIVPPGDKVALCKHTRSLLLNPELARTIGAAARQRASEDFNAEACAARWAEQYSAAA